MAQSPLLEPKKLTQVSRLELVARQVVEGFLSGKHPSPFHGSSAEYADHRPYTIGDEIRAVDWKLMAKTDKLYIKLFEEQTNLRCNILVDTSKSMGAPVSDKAAAKLSKIEYAFRLAACLTYLMLKQNDAVGMVTFDSQIRHFLPARSTASHFRRMIDTLDATKPASDTAIGPTLHQIASRINRRGMVILISDLLDNLDTLADGLAHFRHERHEVLVFHVMDPNELDFPYEKLTRFKDLEGSGSIIANPRNIREKYLERLNTFLTDAKRKCFERGVSYQFAQTSTPYDQMLMSFLSLRRSRG